MHGPGRGDEAAPRCDQYIVGFLMLRGHMHSDFSPNGENASGNCFNLSAPRWHPLAIDFAATRVATLWAPAGRRQPE